MRKIALLVTLILVAALGLALAEPRGEPLYYARVELFVRAEEQVDVLLSPEQVYEVTAPAEPPGFKLHHMELWISEELGPSIIPTYYDKLVEEDGALKGILSFSGKIRLTTKRENCSGTFTIVTYYVKTWWVELHEGEVEVEVPEPVEPFTLKDYMLKVTMDNFAPYAFVGVKAPNGVDIAEVQEDYPPDAFKIDPKHVEIKVGAFGPGKYRLVVKHGECYKLPSAFLVVEERVYNETVQPGATKRFAVKRRKGWTPIGAVVVLYSVALHGGGSGASVSAEMCDLAFAKEEKFNIKAASFLVPPLRMEFWLKAYVVYGNYFEVKNTGKSPINVMYIPVEIKEVGKWSPLGLTATISEDDIKEAKYAYLVVQVPHYGKIKAVVTPSGDRYEDYWEYSGGWLGTSRTLALAENEAYIQVKSGSAKEPGEYIIEIEWEDLKIKAVDANGKPLANAMVTVTGALALNVTTSADGAAKVKLYVPGPYEVTIYHMGIEVARLNLGTITDTELMVKCKVYALTIKVTGVLGQPLKGVIVRLTTKGSTVAVGETDEGGTVMFEQIPAATYKVETLYKRLSRSEKLAVNGNMEHTVKMDVLFEIPFIGIPVTSLETLAIAATGGGVFFVAKRRGAEEEEAEELELGA